MRVKVYEDKNHFLTYDLSHYFLNKNQISPLKPDRDLVTKSISDILQEIQSYINQVRPDATYVINSKF